MPFKSASAPYPEFWLRKIRSMFAMFDHDQDGVIHREDIVNWCVQNAKGRLNQVQMEVFQELMDEAWEYYWAGEEKRTEVTLNDIADSVNRTYQAPGFKALQDKWLGTCFDKVADIDGDGYLTLEEFTTFLGLFGVHPLSVPACFEALKTNKDALISREQFVQKGKEFAYITVDSPAKMFWGPFIA
ncbi:sarcoplasmic calcium-binding protein-like [Lingula anatina]|uniref:Sarcoplasmic calcium-binding protein-like n=1 Tax=Lingula anatina TaxID=7574 RepID=A0A2R2MME6_LINAN|nr:sarcoplasmic calcium-binding protein-like [Lingula anatina]|eukprot:XP_023931385.1 sarcoplasmic calcium-binding protein-like [Lingula anatina]